MLQRTYLGHTRHVSVNPLRSTTVDLPGARAAGQVGFPSDELSPSEVYIHDGESDGLFQASDRGLVTTPRTLDAAAQTEPPGEVDQSASANTNNQRHPLYSSSNLDDSGTHGSPASASTQGTATTALSSSSFQPLQAPPSTTTVYADPAPFPDPVNFGIDPVVSNNPLGNPGSSVVNDVSLDGPITANTLYSIPGNVST